MLLAQRLDLAEVQLLLRQLCCVAAVHVAPDQQAHARDPPVAQPLALRSRAEGTPRRPQTPAGCTAKQASQLSERQPWRRLSTSLPSLAQISRLQCVWPMPLVTSQLSAQGSNKWNI